MKSKWVFTACVIILIGDYFYRLQKNCMHPKIDQ